MNSLRRGTFAVAVLGAVTLGTVSATSASASAQPAKASSPAVHDTSVVDRVETQTAQSLAAALSDQTLRARLRDAALSGGEVDLQALAGKVATPTGKALASQLAAANQRIAAAKGLDASVGSLLRVRLGADSMRASLGAGAAPLVITETADDHATTLTAYDSHGRTQQLDALHVPNRPVYILEIDGTKAVSAGLAVMNRELGAHGLTSPQVIRQDAGGWWATKVDSVRLNDDEEPWFKGDAEIFSLVTGFGLDGKVRVDSVDMPYLNNDGTTYYPNQIVVNWSNYKYNLADIVMMEDDGDTNYHDLAVAIATALLTIADQGTYIPLVNAVLNAIPTSWWTDDPDYVDSWYTLAQSSSGRLNGAAGNGWMTVEPYFVQQF